MSATARPGTRMERIRRLWNEMPEPVRNMARDSLGMVQRGILDGYILSEPRNGKFGSVYSGPPGGKIEPYLEPIERKFLVLEAERNGSYTEDERLVERARIINARTPWELFRADKALYMELKERGLLDALFLYSALEDAAYVLGSGPIIRIKSEGALSRGRKLVAELREGNCGMTILMEAYGKMSPVEKRILTERWIENPPATLEEVAGEKLSRMRVGQIEERLVGRISNMVRGIPQTGWNKKKTITEEGREVVARLRATGDLDTFAAGMTQRERLILERRFTAKPPMRREEVGRQFRPAVCANRVLQLEKELLSRLADFEFGRIGRSRP